MRPDKKKNRHHDSVKCENKAKQKASEKAKKEEKSQHQKKQQQPSGAITKDKNETSSSSKNENFSTTTDNTPKEEVIEKTIPDPKYSKRSVTSNWTKYEIPSDDEDNGDVFATGPEFQFVIEKSSQAADHLMLSSEKQWQKVDEPEIANQQQNEHFALNLKNLETALDCIPLYEFDMFHMKKCEIDKETIATMDAYAKQGQEILQKKLQNDYESVDEVNKKIVENLVIAKKKQSLNLDAEKMAKQSIAVSTSTSARKKDDEDDLEDWLNDYLSD